MPTGASPFSMLGMLMGRASPQRKRSKDSVYAKSQNGSDSGRNGGVQTYKSSKEKIEVAVLVERGGLDSEESSTDDHIYDLVNRSTLPSHRGQEGGWTEVATQQVTADSTTDSDLGSRGSTIYESDQTSSIESLEKQELHEEVRRQADILAKKDADIRSVREEKENVENHLKVVATELLAARQLEGKLSDDIRRMQEGKENAESRLKVATLQLEAVRELEAKIQKLDDNIRRVQEEKGNAESRLRTATTQLQATRQLESRLQKMDDELRTVQKQKDDAESRLKAVTADCKAIMQLNNSRGEENRRQAEEIKRLRENLHLAEADRDDKLARLASGSKEQLDSILRRNRALVDDNQRQLSEIRRLEKRLQEVEGNQVDITKRLEAAEHLNRELDDQNKRHSAERQANEKHFRSLQENSVKTANRLKTTIAELGAMTLGNEELKKQNRVQAEEIQVREKELVRVKGEMAEMTMKTPHSSQLEVLERQNRMLQDQLRHQSRELQNTMSQSLPRPIQALQNLEPSGKEDVLGGVVGLLDTLNSEIFQAAAFMADSLSYASSSTLSAQKIKEAVERSSQTIGRPMVLILRSRLAQTNAEFDPLPIQIALQACLIDSCMRIISSWYPGHWEYGDFLSTIYSRIQDTVGKKVSVKWRTITQAQLRYPSDNHTETTLKVFIIESLVHTLHTAGWSETGLEAEKTLTAFDERLLMIVKLALRLNTSLGEDWEAVTVQPNEPFNSETMEDAYDEYEETEEIERIVCTTDIGLNALSGNGTTVKPKVVIQSMLDEEKDY
ncbi:hypothetical protein BDZ94DRAFT_1254765 [Collybia nuda]|uniref:Uncharacterized protein n=1 Tax=Collybia nuda TaxID=64659 RepID=A0A9P5YAC5_9AGAR|nr:hypothetical protein BDZ94DRAFT_1254765 [Collybia nuda]